MGRLATYTPADAPALPTEGMKFQLKRGNSLKPQQTGKHVIFWHVSAQASTKRLFFAKEFHTEATSNLKVFSFVSVKNY